MLNRERIREIIKLQDTLNTKTAGSDWKDKEYDWRLYAALEVAEALESLPYKHWKKTEADIDNVKVEVIDAFHFILSDSLMVRAFAGEFTASINILTDIEDTMIAQYEVPTKEVDVDSLICRLRYLLSIVLSASDVKLYTTLWCIWNELGETPESFYKAYMVKNILNTFRQTNGYKDGTYKKLWIFHGERVEDNVVAYALAEELNVDEDFTPAIHKALKHTYKDA